MNSGDYVRQADPRRHFWFDFAASEVEQRQQQQSGFSLVIVDNRFHQRAGYRIPFAVVAEMFTEQYLSNTRDGRRRWTGKVIGGWLRVDNCPHRIDVRPYRIERGSFVRGAS
jgi:hypothetical protein